MANYHDMALLYDSINTHTMRCLEYNYKEKGRDLLFYNLGKLDDINKWFLTTVNVFCKAYDHIFYISCSWWRYFYLRFICGYNKLRPCTTARNLYPIKTPVFIQEMADAFEVNLEVLGNIYNEYYKRR